MSELMRMTGMFSGMDTESVVKQLVQVRATKVTNLKNDQKKLEWKQTIWQDLNKRILKLHRGALSDMRLEGSYAKKKTKVSDPTKATITAGAGAVNGAQSLEIKQLATSGYLTGAKLSKKVAATGKTTLAELGITEGKLKVTAVTSGSDSPVTAEIDVRNGSQTVDEFVKSFNDGNKDTTGLTMSFKDGKLSVVSTRSDLMDYTLSSTSGSNGGKTVLQAFDLDKYEGKKQESGGAQIGEIKGKRAVNNAGMLNDPLLADTASGGLGFAGKELTIKARLSDGSEIENKVAVKEPYTIKGFIEEFNKNNGLGLTMSVNDNNEITVKSSNSDVTSYTLSSPTGDNSPDNTLLDWLGLDEFENKTQKKTGGIILKMESPTVRQIDNSAKDGFKADSKMSEINEDLVGKKLKLKVGDKEKEIEITSDMTVAKFVSALKEGGVNASFDEGNQRFFVSSSGTGLAKEFTLEDADGNDTLKALGLYTGTDYTYLNGSKATRTNAQDAQIILNGADFTSDTNTFTVNGLSITAQAVTTDGPISLTTETDYDGIYDMIKNFVTEYNDIMNELTKLYSADSARKFTMLSDDEKDAMSETEVEKWEQTIKDSLLRRDKDVYSVMESMRNAVNKGYDIGGETMYLVNFGVGTLSYWETEKGERNALHVYNDADDEAAANKAMTGKDLKSLIAQDPDKVVAMFTAMSKEMYSSLQKTMEGTDYRSTYKIYDDKRMKTEYDDYTKRIKEAQKKLDDYEDKWYKKFSAMETAMAKMQSNQNSLAGMLGSS